MSVQEVKAPVDVGAVVTAEPKEWDVALRILFRFSFVYFGLFCLVYPQLLFAFTGIAQQWTPPAERIYYSTWPCPLIGWVGRTVFSTDVKYHADSWSGDQKYLWVLVFCIFVTAIVATVVWSTLDRKRPDYRRLSGWYLLFIRVILAGQMLLYGIVKAIPHHMAPPDLITMLTPFGQFSHMAVLWNQIGVSPVYESLLGIAEILAGLLLLLPHTTLPGVLLSLVSMAQVWVLNMTYDMPVKLLSFHLLLLCLVLLAPHAQRLTRFLLGSAVGPATAPEPFRTRKAVRIAAAVQVAMAVWIATGYVSATLKAWHEWGPGREKSELYGIWEVTEFTRDEQLVPLLLTDKTLWRRLVFDYPQMATCQRMDDQMIPLRSEINSDAHLLTLSEIGGEARLTTFTYAQPAPNRMVLAGELSSRSVTIVLTLVDSARFPVQNGGLHLMQEFPNWGAGR